MAGRTGKKRRLLAPGLLFQSILVGGGYGTGAEIAQYFGRHGLWGGLLGMGAAAAVWCLLCAVTFEFARTFRAWDYGSLMGELLGPFSVCYDLCCLAMTLLMLGVAGATAGSMAAGLLDAPSWTGTVLVSACAVWLVLRGTEAVETALSLWSYVLYGVYVLFLLAVFSRFGGAVWEELSKGEITSGWLGDSLRYAAYNLVMAPLVLYTLRDVKSRGEAALCGVLSGLLAIFPGVLLLLAMGCDLPAVTAAELPVSVIFGRLEMRWLYILFEIVLFGTLVESATGFIQAVTDRAETAAARKGRRPPAWLRPLTAAGLAAAGGAVSALGLSNLVERGYGAAGYGFAALYALPMLTVGVRKLAGRRRKPRPARSEKKRRLIIWPLPRATSTLVKRRRLW